MAGFILPTQRDADALKRAAAALRDMRGDGLVNSRGQITTRPPQQSAASAPAAPRREGILGIITGVADTPIGTFATYTAKTARIQADGTVTAYPDGDPLAQEVDAANLAESDLNQEAIPVDTPVHLFWTYSSDGTPPSQTWYFEMLFPPTSDVSRAPIIDEHGKHLWAETLNFTTP